MRGRTVTKHFCENCATHTHFDDDEPCWVTDWEKYGGGPFSVYATKIHTGKIASQCSYATREEAERYIAKIDPVCTSHKDFFIIDLRKSS